MQVNLQWLRLARYAARRAFAFRLEALPCDLLVQIALRHLNTPQDFSALMTALYGVPLLGDVRWPDRETFGAVPMPLRQPWVLARARYELRAALYRCSPPALYYARDNLRLHACLDWSPFSAHYPSVGAVYSWDRGPLSMDVRVFELEIERVCREHVRDGRPCCTVALYRVCPQPIGTDVWFPRPVTTFGCQLVAASLLPLLPPLLLRG